MPIGAQLIGGLAAKGRVKDRPVRVLSGLFQKFRQGCLV